MELETDRGKFGQVLRRLRLAAGLSQEELAERARLSVEGVSALERGRRKAPYRETIRLLSDALDLSDAHRAELALAAKRGRAPAAEIIRFDSGNAGASAPADQRDAEPPKQNLVRSLSTFYGRTREIADLTRLIAEHRFYTIVGAGGIGKTRVAIELGWALLRQFPDGVWFIDLAPLNDNSALVRSFFEALRISADPAQDDVETLARYLRHRNTLLIIDNCEHVIEQASLLVEALLPACDSLRILATSREPLRALGERVYRMAGLDAPLRTEQLRADEGMLYPSIALFVDRATAANSTFIHDDATAPTVAAISRRLDGIALAIELAASRMTALTPQQILAQLEHHFRILGGGRRTALPRQQTMHETIRWSYDRLSSVEQQLFRRVAVFISGFTSKAAAAVMDDTNDGAAGTLDLLASLIDKSLVITETHGPATRYRLLEPMRAFALELLGNANEMPALRPRYMNWCLAFTRDAHEAWATSPTSVWFAEVEPEMENLRACVTWALLDGNDIENGQRLVAGGRRVWARLSPYESANWIEVANRLVGPRTPTDVRAALALAEAHLHLALQQHDAVVRAVEKFERAHDPLDVLQLAEARCFAGLSLTRLGRSSEGEPLMAASVAIYRAHGADQLAATGFIDLACAHLTRNDLPQARSLFIEARAIFQKLDNKRGLASVAANLAEIEYAAGNVELAIRLCREAISTADSAIEACLFLSNLAAYLVRAGEYDEARLRARESLQQLMQLPIAREGENVDVALATQHLAAVAVLRSETLHADDPQIARAARIVGFVDDRLAKFGIIRLPTESHEYAVLLASLEAALGAEPFRALRDEGRAWSAEKAIDEAFHI